MPNSWAASCAVIFLSSTNCTFSLNFSSSTSAGGRPLRVSLMGGTSFLSFCMRGGDGYQRAPWGPLLVPDRQRGTVAGGLIRSGWRLLVVNLVGAPAAASGGRASEGSAAAARPGGRC